MGNTLKLLAIILLSICISAAEMDPTYSYNDFMRDYRRNYKGIEIQVHERKFNIGYGVLQKLKQQGQDVVISQFLDWSQQQINSTLFFYVDFFNYSPENSHDLFSIKEEETTYLSKTQAEFDWRARGVVTPVKEQGKSDSSLTLALIGLFQSILAIKMKYKISDLSEKYLLDPLTQHIARHVGSSPLQAFRLIQQHWIQLDKQNNNIQSSTDNNLKSDPPQKTTFPQLLQSLNLKNFKNLSINQLEKDLTTHGPILVGVTANDPAFKYAGPSGLIRCAGLGKIDHAVLLVGYNQDYWVVKNWWGKSWGHQGYGYISKNVGNDCGIRDYVTEIQGQVSEQEEIPQSQSRQLVNNKIKKRLLASTDPNALDLTITMTDSALDGWNGNILAIKQNGLIVDIFGSNFVSGGSADPIVITVQGDKEVQIVVSQLGTNTEQIGFTVTAPNGTVIHQRNSGVVFYAGTIFSNFCPVQGCVGGSYLRLTVTMTDSASDGWNGNVLGIKQNGAIVESFGSVFTSGGASGPVYIFVQGDKEAQIVVAQLGSNSQQVAFIINAQNGTIVHQRTSGAVFFGATIFAGFCPINACASLTMKLNIAMYDSNNDGWNGNVVSIKQNGAVLDIFGSSFTSGSSGGTVFITVQADLEVQVVAYQLGTGSDQVYFYVRFPNNTLIYNRPSGTVYYAGTILNNFCPTQGCVTNSLKVNIAMTDSGADGWNGNVLAVKQNGLIMDAFGAAFTAGATSGPVSIILQGDKEAQVVVYQFGTNANQIGFTITASNGTVIHQRASGVNFFSATTFTSFCPIQGCPVVSLRLTIAMTDSGSDGWNGNILGIKQNGVIIDTFGTTFTAGATSGPTYITVQGDKEVQIVVSQLGTNTEQIGFTVTAPNGTVIHQRNSGVVFYAGTIFSNFCPVQGCVGGGYLRLTVTMTDSASDGWNGNVLAIKQNGAIVESFGSLFTSDGASGPVYIVVQGDKEAQIVVAQLGSNSQQIGFVVTAPNGTVIHQRNSDTQFELGMIFSYFCPIQGCALNSMRVSISMTDSGSDGWNGNILAIKQDGNIVDTFGKMFTSGSEAGPSFVIVQGDKEVQVIVYQYGTSTEQIGFTITASNGTILYQRFSGVGFLSSIVFSGFCPIQGCTALSLKLAISMTDSGSDGWNGNILGIKQNGVIIDTFGTTFTAGAASGLTYITVQGDKEVQIVVFQLGTNTEQVGFTVTAPNGTVIHQRNSGVVFYAGTIFSNFCPVQGCVGGSYLRLTVTMTDSASDGWNGNILGIKQNGAIVESFGSLFTSGGASGPVYIFVQGDKEAQIVVAQLGSNSQQVGFTINAPNGTIVHQRTSGAVFFGATIFAGFCPINGCASLTMKLNIAMYDSNNDGWNGNVVSIKQNGAVLDIFGSSFTSGSSGGTVYITVQADLEVQVVAYQLGTGSDQVYFYVRFPNNTLIYNRPSGTVYYAGTILSNFCPTQGCVTNSLKVNIAMTDSGADGWNGNILAIKQNGLIMDAFGAAFTAGATSGPVSIILQGDKEAQVVVYQFGTNANQIGFTITASNGTVIHQRASGVNFFSTTTFTSFCPIQGCPVVFLRLTIAMTDSGSDGWNGNVLGIKQNGVIIDTFGTTFTAGATSGPTYITVQGDKEAQVVVYQLGTNTEQVGFTVTAPNGTVIHQRNSGVVFYAGTIFSNFCPVQGCVGGSYLRLTVTMTDSASDGWNGNILGIKQNGAIVESFGSLFTSDGASGPVYIVVQGDKEAQIVVTQLGSNSQQIGFVVTAPNETVIHQRNSDTQFELGMIFSYFCPIQGCALNSMRLSITMTDSGADGWNGNILAIKQNGLIAETFGSTFTSDASKGPVFITLQADKEAQVVVYQLGTNTDQIGFSITAPNGTVLYQKSSGITFYSGTIFANFCPTVGCVGGSYMKLTISMTDSGADGWNGNILAIKQNGAIIETFGSTFTSGATIDPVSITLQGDKQALVTVAQLGSNSQQIGFSITASNGTVICQRASGVAFYSSTIFSGFCPILGCVSSTLRLSITMTDSAADGWNGNILAVKQNGAVMETFGSLFTSGGSSGPVYITVMGDKDSIVVVSQVGANSQQIGFTITAPNGTIIHQRTSGVIIYPDTIFTNFCPILGCTSNYFRLTLSMTDSASDGWNGNILAIRQNGVIIDTFGGAFTSGFSATSYITVQSDVEVQVVVAQVGINLDQVSFIIRAPNGTIFHNRPWGTVYNPGIVFAFFCPTIGCSTVSSKLNISMTDSGSDGWNGNILAIKQNGLIVDTFGSAFTSGASSGPVSINVLGDKETQIIVSQLGTSTDQVGFVVTASNGTVMHQRASGVIFYLGTIFSNFCPVQGCLSGNTLKLAISMTDSGADGWNGNILAIKQNNVNVETFGTTFNSGSANGPLYIIVQGDKEVQIVVVQLGSNTQQIGFTVTAPNGTIIHQRDNGVTFYSGTIFSNFCPIQGCPASNNLKLTIMMTDSGADGWNGAILAVKQNGAIIETFGNGFTAGSASGPVYVTVSGDKEAQIVVAQLGISTDQVGFTITAPNGTIIHQRASGVNFFSATTFTSFCPILGCPVTFLRLSIAMTDSGSDGWNGTILGIKQNGVIIDTFGTTFTAGAASGPTYITVQGDKEVQIVVSQLGTSTEQIGFTVTAPNGTVIHQRNSGVVFYTGTIFSNFCPVQGCVGGSYLRLTVTMTDSASDGWNGNILAIKQNGAIVESFGSLFTSGGASGPVYIVVQGDKEAQIVVAQIGSSTDQIGLTITAPNATVVYQRSSGTLFYSGSILSYFCPILSCSSNTIKLTITMTDSGSDGWNSNILAIRQGGAIIDTFGNLFTTGASSGPVTITVSGDKEALVVIYQLGSKTDEIGFTIKVPNGTIAYQRVSGTQFYLGTVLSNFCPIQGCPSSSLKLAVSMTDSASDGWSGTIISVKQESALVGTFGSAFTSGGTSGPLYFTVLGQKQVQIAVSQPGTNTQQVGFSITAPNGTIIHQRASGTQFNSATIFSYFCPIQGCLTSNNLKLTISMTDSGADGWNGTILGVKQNGVIVESFGSGFTSGATNGPVYVTVVGDKEVQIVVTQLGVSTDQVGFVITAPNGTVIIQRNSGIAFSAGTIFSNFCPIQGCPASNLITLTIAMTDSGNDGWNSNILAIKQNGLIVQTFGSSFTAGGASGPVSITVEGDKQVQIVVSQLGSKSNQIGFSVTAPNKTIIHQRTSRTQFYSTTIFSNFCPIKNCPSGSYLKLAIAMTDSGTDGWNGTVLAVKQNGVILETFGNVFTSGATYDPAFITVLGDKEVQIIVSKLGVATDQVGFVVTAPNGTVIHRRIHGTVFYSGTIFSSFCPIQGCPASSTLTLTITMTDSDINGWNTNLLAIKQNGAIMETFGTTFTSCYSTDPALITVQGDKQVQIVVLHLGTLTESIGFLVTAPNGTVIYQRAKGTPFYSGTIFSSFCPIQGCPSTNLLTLKITMTDSGADGWNSNVLAILQDAVIIEIFGNAFISGNSADPLYIKVVGNKEVQIVVSQLGSNTEQIGFAVTAPNGTVIYQRTSGVPFYQGAIFSGFCPIQGCSPTNLLTVTISLTDSGADGWNSNILAIKQEGATVGAFGSTFTSGATSGPVSIILLGNKEAQIVVHQLGTKTEEIGFTVTASNGSAIYQRVSGTQFFSGTIFSSFCPIQGCPTNSLRITITMTDSGSDGWSGTVLAIQQEGAIVKTFGNTFTSGSTSSSISATVLGNKEAQIVVSQLGTNTDQIGFVVTASNGTVIYERQSGVAFYPNTVFTNFCPIQGCLNTNYLKLTITMTSIGVDGWNQNILAIKQNDLILQTFGSTFTSGSSSCPTTITVPSNKNTQIVVSTLSTKTQQIGFVVLAPNGTTIHQRVYGTPFTSNTIFSNFCPISGCPYSNLLTLKIDMTSATLEGWNGTVLGVWQDGGIVESFGAGFVSGNSYGPVYITVHGDKQVMIVVSQYGTNTQNIGFTVTAPNTTQIHQRSPGTQFHPSTIFSSFCPKGGCSSNTLKLTITMTDSGLDGWNNNILAIRQNGAIRDTFGSGFVGGSTGESVSVVVLGDAEVQVGVWQIGGKSQEIGFVVKAENGTIIYQRVSGTQFYPGTIFTYFCPSQSCQSTCLKLTITMADSGLDGWNNNILAIKQSDLIVDTFGNLFTTGKTSGPITIPVQSNAGIQIVVYQLGTKSNEISYIIKAPNGTIVNQRSSGAVFVAETVFGTFCMVGDCGDVMILGVMMTDTVGDGWNYNVIGVKQKGVLVGTFGAAFKTGTQSGPVFIAVLGNQRVQIAVATLGLRTNQIGFVVKATDGTIIYQRTSGTTFTYTSVFRYFCPIACSNTLALTITMTDSAADGWNGNVLAIRQNNAIIGTLGASFISGDRSDTSITVQGDKQVQIIVSQLTTNTDQLGFSITAPNGTVIAQRLPGVSSFTSKSILSNFCPIQQCPNNYLTVFVSMTDSGADGWNGNIFGIKQNGVIVDTFGSSFTTGSSKGPLPIIIQGDIQTEIVFSQFGAKLSQVGFVIAGPTGAVISRKYVGTIYTSSKIFTRFCPITCQTSPNIIYNLTMTDTNSNGWQGTVIDFRQNGVAISSFTLESGSSSQPAEFTFPKFVTTTVNVNVLGANSQEIGFKVVNAYGEIVFQRVAGVRMYVSTPLGSFCPECVNLSPVPTVVGSTEIIPSQTNPQNPTPIPIPTTTQPQNLYIITTYTLSVILILTVTTFLICSKKSSKQSHSPQQPPQQVEQPLETQQFIQEDLRPASSVNLKFIDDGDQL